MRLLIALCLLSGCVSLNDLANGDPADASFTAPAPRRDLAIVFDPIDATEIEDLAAPAELEDLAAPADLAPARDFYDPCYQGCTFCASDDPGILPAHWKCHPCGYVNGVCMRDFRGNAYNCSPDDLGPCH